MKQFSLFPFVCVVFFAARSLLAAESIEFNRDIRPILSDKCFQCHGPDEQSREADLRLDILNTTQSPFGAESITQAIVPGEAEASELWRRISSQDESDVMPPPDAHKKTLTKRQLRLIKQWIKEGAEYDAFWAFVPPEASSLPQPKQVDWCRTGVDHFVLKRLEANRVEPKERADRRTLIRRVTFDLTGLPPTLAEIEAFLEDRSPAAYGRVVERLLNSPRYGEHMAKYWIDLVRFADTNGIHHDHYREMTPYRDWIIRAFNSNLRFDDFTRYQLAGDLYEHPTNDQLIASGFNRLHLVIDRGTALPEESFVRNVTDRVNAVGTAFLGMTVGCAVCHDHKYDPITQREYFQLYAFFNNIDATPETPGRNTHEPALRLPTSEQTQQLDVLTAQITNQKSKVATLKRDLKKLEEATSITPEDTQAEDGQQVQDSTLDTDRKLIEESAIEKAKKRLANAEANLKQTEDQKRRLESQVAVTLIMKERDEVRPAHILIRGAYDAPGEIVERKTPDFLPPLSTKGPIPTRMDLANWLLSPGHPLTARVTVNRFWQQFFGVGLVRTSEDFGAQGEVPSDPALLNYLAMQFVKSGWDIKELVRAIVLSSTYAQSSVATEAEFASDPDNRLLARGARFRLDSEMIRDQILFTSGLLSDRMFGRSVKPPQPPDLWKNVSMVSSSTYAFKADEGEDIYRRSLYTFWKRALPPPQMTIFDAPTRESCTARRERTNTPLQALVLMNEQRYFEAAIHYAQRLLREKEMPDAQRLQRAFEDITSHVPDAQESDDLLSGLNALRELYREDEEAARQLTGTVDKQGKTNVELAAYTMIVNALFNLDVTKTRQ